MFKFVLGVVVSAAAFYALSLRGSPIGDLTGAEARVVSAALAVGHGDRAAELQEPVLKKPDGDGWFVCGWVRIGGADAPLGAQPFVGLLFDDGTFAATSLAVTEGERNATKEVCAYRGLYI